MRRRRWTEREVVATLLQQGAIIPCGKCRKAITDADNCQREHLHQLATGGEDTVDNCRYWHKNPCSHEKSFGTKATSAGSDAHIRAKGRRVAKAKDCPDRGRGSFGTYKRAPTVKESIFTTRREKKKSWTMRPPKQLSD